MMAGPLTGAPVSARGPPSRFGQDQRGADEVEEAQPGHHEAEGRHAKAVGHEAAQGRAHHEAKAERGADHAKGLGAGPRAG